MEEDRKYPPINSRSSPSETKSGSDNHGASGKPQSLWKFASLGTEFTAIILFFILGGSWIDKNYLFSPWGLILGMLLGFSLGLTHIILRTRGM